MHQDVAILLEVQQDDTAIFGLEDKLAALAPRLAALEAATQRAEQARADANAAVESEERRQRDLQFRVGQHRDLLKRHEEVLNTVSAPREAAAAVAQTEQARRMLADDEREIAGINARLGELRAQAKDREASVAATQAVQAEARTSLEADRKALLAALQAARAQREQRATTIPRPLLARYDRIQKRQRSVALFALHGPSCGHCDTMIPMQRRNVMVGTGAPEVCEGCGVLLYAGD